VPARGLIVDDHHRFRQTARRVLEADGWTVVGEAADGAGAIDAIRSLDRRRAAACGGAIGVLRVTQRATASPCC
jgi:CheY-like chemotaxis protein